MLEVHDLSVRYGPVRALDAVSFTARRGEITAVLGANGAGKTTMLRAISGLLPQEQGSVLLDGTDLRGVPTEERSRLGLAHVPEGRGVIAQLTVAENLRLGSLGRTRGSMPVSRERIYELFPVLGDRSEALAHVLSGGERQMLVVGRALIAAPKVLLLDEPSLGLAGRVVSQIFRTIRDLVERDGLTVVLVEQNARSALSIADHAVVLNLGRLVAEDSAAVLAQDEQLRHAYLGL
ncbi:ABC transporter ATP-binding protein [Intrasporangium sp.]|uniref:ABC transporter ATP-binding protein n=1 Tax=Intrasporangium sp. TaxID=1925024 RepID=UPI00293B813C|nr:ABC transporter ATP-binding protein [Intrasporangium sp.]MDV3222016.1 ABC transporter ATP-binding protein [Intrasporangium sp.]